MSKIEFSQTLLGAVWSTWQSIASDVLQCAAEMGEEVDGEECVESCMDAGHMLMYGGSHAKEAEDELSELIDAYGYEPVLTALAKEVRL